MDNETASQRASRDETAERIDSDSFIDWEGLKTALGCWAVALFVLLLLASRLAASAPPTSEEPVTSPPH